MALYVYKEKMQLSIYFNSKLLKWDFHSYITLYNLKLAVHGFIIGMENSAELHYKMSILQGQVYCREIALLIMFNPFGK